MGRIKTQLIKRTAYLLLNKFGSQFSEDFTSNKTLVDKYVSVSSHKLRNTIAGYMTRLVKMRKVKGI